MKGVQKVFYSKSRDQARTWRKKVQQQFSPYSWVWENISSGQTKVQRNILENISWGQTKVPSRGAEKLYP